LLKWTKRVCKGAIVLLLATVLVGVGYEQWSRWSVARSFPPSGDIYEVDGRRSHLHCSGDGSPTVILEAGLDSGGSLSWSNIYPDLAERSRVCSYDRAGIMWSQSRDEPRDALSIADELHALLAAASESPPYIMVGHSIGGILVRVFDQRFPGEVVGFVFVDSSHPEQNERLPPEFTEANLPPLALIRTLSAIGVLRLISSSAGPGALPEEAAAARDGFRPKSTVGTMREMAALSATLKQGDQERLLGDRPLIVLTAGRLPDSLPPGIGQSAADRFLQEVWPELQTELAALSTNSDHRIRPNATHYVHWDDPEAVVAAIREVAEAARNHTAVRVTS